MNLHRPPQASLPEGYENIIASKRNIEKMKEGDQGYVTPWAMWVDTDRLCWLHPEYEVYPEPLDTARMRITRQPDGYHVWNPGHYTWDLLTEPSYVSPVETQYIPVVEFHR